MPTVNKEEKEALSKAVGDAIDSMFDGKEGGIRNIEFVPNADGSVLISNPPIPETAGPFFEAFESYMEEEEVRKMDEAARASMEACGICKYCLRMPCVASSEYESMMELGVSMEADNKANNEIRFALYSYMSRVYFGHLGQGVRKKLPVCVVGEIHDAYPATNGAAYVGFKAKDDAH